MLDICQVLYHILGYMVDKELVKMLYENGDGFTTIGKKVGVTRQRIHQIVRGYHQIFNSKQKYNQLYKTLCSVCHLRRTENLHHIDHNVENNTLDNLLPVCISCHRKFHSIKRGRWSRDYDACLRCGRVSVKHKANGYCSYCYHAVRNIKRFGVTYCVPSYIKLKIKRANS